MSTWRGVIGHDWAVALLRDAIQHDRIGHAYLFTGPAHIGKATLARLFAQGINCTDAAVAARPCGQCRSCQLIQSGRHPDLKQVTGTPTGRGRLSLKIEQIRDLQAALNLAAYEARFQVALIEGFDAATIGAANAFLKTLEEPPSRVVLLLTAVDADQLLPTITSRCRIVALRPLDAATVAQALTDRWHVAPPLAGQLARLAGGRLGWAVTAAHDASLLDERTANLAALRAVLGENHVARFQRAEKLARHPEQLTLILETWLSWWRDLFLIAWGGRRGAPITNIDDEQRLRHVSQLWEREQILNGLRQTRATLWHLEQNANTRLALENLFLAYPLAFVD